MGVHPHAAMKGVQSPCPLLVPVFREAYDRTKPTEEGRASGLRAPGHCLLYSTLCSTQLYDHSITPFFSSYFTSKWTAMSRACGRAARHREPAGARIGQIQGRTEIGCFSS